MTIGGRGVLVLLCSRDQLNLVYRSAGMLQSSRYTLLYTGTLKATVQSDESLSADCVPLISCPLLN